MKRSLKLTACLAVLVATCLVSRVAFSRADDTKKDDTKKPAAADQFAMLSRLEGTWESDKVGPDGKSGTTVFHTTSGKSVVTETMLPGNRHEMINTFYVDGDNLVMTHYCAMGNQPHLKSVGGDANTIKFDFVSCSNLKDKQGCMGGLEMIVDGDTLTEKWSFLQDGKAGEPEVFTYHRKA